MEVDAGSSSLPPDPTLVSGAPRPRWAPDPSWSCTKGTGFSNPISRDRQIVAGKEMCKEREWFGQSRRLSSIPLLLQSSSPY